MMKIILVSFADSRLYRSADRLRKEALQSNFFQQILIFNESDLDPKFREHFKDQLTLGSRGFGYWCWKPQIIKQVLEQSDPDDIIVYLDVGFKINSKGYNRFQDYIEMVKKNSFGMLAFQTELKKNSTLNYDGRELLNYQDRFWTKGDVLDYFNVRDNLNVIETPTIGAGIFLVKNNANVRSFVDRWIKVFRDNFDLLNDSKSQTTNLDGFIEHRHDQSIFSILCKIHGIETTSAYEYWYPSKTNKNHPDWNALAEFPFWARRDKNFGFILSILFLFKRVLRKLKLLQDF